jgi:hypothetical protein
MGNQVSKARPKRNWGLWNHPFQKDDMGWRMNVSEREIWEFKKRFRDSFQRW